MILVSQGACRAPQYSVAHDANVLAARDWLEFQKWAVFQLGGLPKDKPGADGGIDGIIRYHRVGLEQPNRAVVSVKGGVHVGVDAVHKLKSVMQREGAEVGQCLFEHIDRTGSFSGPMRKNLVEMLDGIGVNALLGVSSCLSLFDTLHHMVHFTSVVSAPIFKDGENYRGYGPPLLQVPKLEGWVVENLAAELASIPQAVIVPLGRVADAAIQFLKQNATSLDRRCLTGFPHPSGANGHRQQDFRRGREQWGNQISSLKIE